MRRRIGTSVLALALATATWGAAPPARGPVRLTAEQEKHVAGLAVRANRAYAEGDFEEIAKLLAQAAEYRAKHLGARHHEAINVAWTAEEWRRLTKVPAKDRADVLRAKVLNFEAALLLNEGKYREAEQKARAALAIDQKTLGEAHPSTAGSYKNVAYSLKDQGKAQEALLLYNKALAICQKALGEAHPSTAASYNDVALCLQDLGKASEALPLHKKALLIREKALGEDHPDTATSHSNVASCLESLGKASEALPLHKKALAIYQKTLGEADPYTANSYNNVASCLQSLDLPQKALPLYKKALLIREKALGEAHPTTAGSCNNVASCLRAQGKTSEALPFYKKALAIFQKALGEAHPHTAAGYNNVAYCLNALGKASEALPLYKKALLIREKALGEEHPDTAASYSNVAHCLQALGKASEALPLDKKALAIFQKALGEGHPETARSYNNVGLCLQALGKASEALPLLKKALAIFQKALGEAHTSTAEGYNNVAYCLNALGKASEALPLYKKALLIREKALGEEHPDTARSYNNVATCLESLGKAQEALPLLKKALAIYQKALGEAHPDTAWACNNVAGCLCRLAKYAEAAGALRSALLGWEYGRLNAGETGFDRSLFRAEQISPRQGLAACLVRADKPAEAWAQAESHLARGLLEDLDADKGGEDRERLARIAALNAGLLPLLARTELSQDDRERRDSLIEQRAKWEAQMAKAVVERSDARTLSLARVQGKIPADAAIVLWIDLDYFEEHLACVVRDKGDPVWVRLPGSDKGGKWTKDDQLLAARTLEALQKPVADPAEHARLLAALHKQRIAPLEKHLKGVRRLLVVPTGRMAKVPVEALTDKYTVSYVPSASVYAKRMEDHRALKGDTLLVLADPAFTAATPAEPPADGVLLTAVLPGGSAARAGLRPGDVLLLVGKTKIESADDLPAALKQPAEALVWRDGEEITVRLAEGKLSATVDQRSARAAVRAWRRQSERSASPAEKWEALPGTRVELKSLKALVPKCTVLEGKDATERRLETMAEAGELKGFRLLHLATHGQANAAFVRETALILAQHKQPSEYENLRRVRAGKRPLTNRLSVDAVLRTWTLDADLVTLSACETGIGGEGGGEGMLGFAQALLQKGARSVLLSRWKVDDSATALLMARFYENVLGKRDGLKSAMKRAEGLQEAKKWLRELPRSEAEKRLAKLTDGLPRGVIKQGLPERKGDAPKGKDDRPFDHPYFWAAFVLIGDPD